MSAINKAKDKAQAAKGKVKKGAGKAAGQTDGWRYADMPEDGQAWRDTLAYLDGDACERCGTPFADAPQADQAALVQAVQDLKSAHWHGLPAAHVWSLWTRYACAAFYAHPSAWT